LYEKAL
jgi:tetratricopeptide (TPR) repeat protein